MFKFYFLFFLFFYLFNQRHFVDPLVQNGSFEHLLQRPTLVLELNVSFYEQFTILEMKYCLFNCNYNVLILKLYLLRVKEQSVVPNYNALINIKFLFFTSWPIYLLGIINFRNINFG